MSRRSDGDSEHTDGMTAPKGAQAGPTGPCGQGGSSHCCVTRRFREQQVIGLGEHPPHCNGPTAQDRGHSGGDSDTPSIALGARGTVPTVIKLSVQHRVQLSR